QMLRIGWIEAARNSGLTDDGRHGIRSSAKFTPAVKRGTPRPSFPAALPRRERQPAARPPSTPRERPPRDIVHAGCSAASCAFARRPASEEQRTAPPAPATLPVEAPS